MNLSHLLRLKIGHCADDMMMSAACMKMAKAGGHADHAAKHEAHLAQCAEHMGNLTQHALALGMKSDDAALDADDDTMKALPAAQLSAYQLAAKYAAPRALRTLAQVHAALGIQVADGSDSKITPALLNLKEQATAATSAAAANARTTAGSNAATLTAQCAAKVAELSGSDPVFMSPATASQALGLNPVTGKKDPLFPPWTLAQLEQFETQARANHGQLAGPGVVSPPLHRQPLQQPQIDPGAGLLTPSSEEVEGLMSMVGCTREEAMAQLKANKAGNYGPGFAATPAKTGRGELLSLLREALKEGE